AWVSCMGGSPAGGSQRRVLLRPGVTPEARGHAVLADADAALAIGVHAQHVVAEGARAFARERIVQVPGVVAFGVGALVVAVVPAAEAAVEAALEVVARGQRLQAQGPRCALVEAQAQLA